MLSLSNDGFGVQDFASSNLCAGSILCGDTSGGLSLVRSGSSCHLAGVSVKVDLVSIIVVVYSV